MSSDAPSTIGTSLTIGNSGLCKEKIEVAKRVSVINFKGGVGKTTLAFHLGTGLARYHQRKVLLIDMDHQSSLSIVCLGAKNWLEAVHNNRTVASVFEPFVGQRNQLPSEEIISTSPMVQKLGRWQGRHYRTMDIVASSLQLDDIEIELTASHHGNAIHSEWNKRTLLCGWLEESGLDSQYDYVIFDCPPATKVVSQNAIAASHGYVIPVVPEAVMERGAPHLHQMVKSGIDDRLNALAAMGENRSMHVPNTELIGLVITRIQTSSGYSGYTNDHSQHLSSLQKLWKEKLVTPYVLQGTGVSQALAEGVPVYDRSHTQNVGKRGLHTQFRNLTRVLKSRIDDV